MSDYTLPSDSESEGKSPGFLHWWESPATPSDPGSMASDPASTPSEDDEDGCGNGSEGQEEDGGGAACDTEDEEEGQEEEEEEEEDADSKFTRLEAQEATDDKAAARKKSRALARAARRRPLTDDEDAISSSFNSSTGVSSSSSDEENGFPNFLSERRVANGEPKLRDEVGNELAPWGCCFFGSARALGRRRRRCAYVRAPLADPRDKVAAFRAVAASTLDALRARLGQRASASGARELLELPVVTSHVVSKVW
ncbi:hypothetical protein QYE76_009692 [Lolium multiflorum]|uniref:Uncharacterized protein n=1 Tax=Lolium multiflorum TaxID=4521 RepID=A0AAD8TSD4_LOLMU|nr:hypothetical protein QYE76_009692 [Lolium multiflorum]